VLGRLLVVGAPCLDLHNFPVRIHRDDDILEPKSDATGEDLVSAETDVLDLLAGAREAVPKDRLEAEPRARLGPLVRQPEVVAVHLDVLARARLLRGRDVLHHADGDDRIEFFGRLVVEVAAHARRHPGDLPTKDLVVLCA
jgi:hypothetical protein